MEDLQIINLYLNRDETAILETDKKYGTFCHSVALNVLSIKEDAEECVNDAYLRAWDVIPPQRPTKFGAWLGKVVRNIAINLWNKNHRQKRYAGMEQILDELQDCIPSPQTVDREIEEKELTEVINEWLLSLSKSDRVLFVRRYWIGISINELSKEYSTTPNILAKRMYNLRQKLKFTLEQEGYSI